MNHFSEQENMPVLTHLINKAMEQLDLLDVLSKSAIIYVHHALKTSVNMISGILQLGVKPNHFFVLGKHYSECPAVVDKIKRLGVYYEPCSPQIKLGEFSISFTRDICSLWTTVVKTLTDDIKFVIIVDHGGYALSSIPTEILSKYSVIGVEKTTGGLIHLNTYGAPRIPIVNVAESAAKKILESPFIAKAIIKKLIPILPLKTNHLFCGVIGYGAIGAAVYQKLISMGYSVIVYDKKLTGTKDIETLINLSDYIFGCTGTDIFDRTKRIEEISKDKKFISCSSGDVEFLSLLKLAQQQYTNNKRTTSPLDNIQYHTKNGATLTLLNGGFPINFDDSGESSPPNEIQLTRTLALAGILQCAEFLNRLPSLPNLTHKPEIYALNAESQRTIVKEWLKYQHTNKISNHLIKNFKNVNWIENHSSGVKAKCFNKNISPAFLDTH